MSGLKPGSEWNMNGPNCVIQWCSCSICSRGVCVSTLVALPSVSCTSEMTRHRGDVESGQGKSPVFTTDLQAVKMCRGEKQGIFCACVRTCELVFMATVHQSRFRGGKRRCSGSGPDASELRLVLTRLCADGIAPDTLHLLCRLVAFVTTCGVSHYLRSDLT